MTETGIWSQSEADQYHASSPKLADFLCKYLNPSLRVYDFGCGRGYYLHELHKAGFLCSGIEGSQLNNFMHDNVMIHDLTRPVKVGSRGTVLSFETGEHLPESAEQIFIETLVDACESKLIISWATPGQPGQGHINCRSHEYVTSEIERRGFRMMVGDTNFIRQHVDKKCDWLQRNLIVFERI